MKFCFFLLFKNLAVKKCTITYVVLLFLLAVAGLKGVRRDDFEVDEMRTGCVIGDVK